MKVLAIPATNSRNGINRQLLEYAKRLLEGGLVANADVVILDINDHEMPIFSTERHQSLGIPEPARRLYDAIGSVDAVIISFAEHNGSYTAAWKNLYDWTSRIDTKVYQSKPTVMLSTSPGAGGAANVLAMATKSAPYFGADLKASMSVPSFFDNFDVESGRLSDGALVKGLQATLSHLAEAPATPIER